ncbi:hypothetical protein [Belliella aquatica]|uniref:Uncharacterized protein n=1 Tax=Belliella aquatica TaxID=1323734 RepID=A0ABQ1MWJ2_9BACT|nr:hypothetical protein [Belliella aquatica]MCH7406600.1 hypothetical protein [Belliella aquatica]GGC48180.1 hypothetical protein GCM10010993_28350 [Belliella aquatica]
MEHSQNDSAICEKISEAFSLRKAKLLTSAINQGGGKAIYMDAFTGKILWSGDPFEFGYVYSPVQIYDTYKDLLSADQIAEIVNCTANVIVSLSVILESLQEHDPESWLAQEEQMKTFDLDISLARRCIHSAKTAISKAAEKYMNA